MNSLGAKKEYLNKFRERLLRDWTAAQVPVFDLGRYRGSLVEGQRVVVFEDIAGKLLPVRFDFGDQAWLSLERLKFEKRLSKSLNHSYYYHLHLNQSVSSSLKCKLVGRI